MGHLCNWTRGWNHLFDSVLPKSLMGTVVCKPFSRTVCFEVLLPLAPKASPREISRGSSSFTFRCLKGRSSRSFTVVHVYYVMPALCAPTSHILCTHTCHFPCHTCTRSSQCGIKLWRKGSRWLPGISLPTDAITSRVVTWPLPGTRPPIRVFLILVREGDKPKA